MRTLCTLVILMAIGTSAAGQERNRHWFWQLDVRLSIGPDGPALITGPPVLEGWDGQACMSDVNGALQFYSGRDGVRNASGAHIQGNTVFDGIEQFRNVSALPWPENPTHYLLLAAVSEDQSFDEATKWLGYVDIDMSEDTGHGGIVSPQFQILDDSVCFMNVTTPHGNGSDYWVLTHKLGSADFHCFQIGALGPVSVPVVSSTGPVLSDNPYVVQDARFSYDGGMLAMVNNGTFELFTFNDQDGTLDWVFTEPEAEHMVTAEFSHSGRYLYAIDRDSLRHIYQYDLVDLNQAAIMASKTSVFELEYIQNVQDINTYLRLAPDRRIYFDHLDFDGDSSFLCAIDRPDTAGLACDVQYQMMDVAPGSFFNRTAVNQCKRYHDSGNAVSMAEQQAPAVLQIWPTPVLDGRVWLQVPEQRAADVARIHDDSGRLVRTIPIGRTVPRSLDVSGLAAGSYTVSLLHGAETVGTGRLLIASGR
ncbi:MAG: T9SS type A sorting domain-containing protein [Flavobacteriales bacterium]|nr:T9SS type A sorting domain-containing protein [Flavobacteriales bacterium]